MSRRRKSTTREIIPDPRFGDAVLAKFIRSLMVDGKKNVAESLIHFTNGKLNWVSLSNGIQSKNIGEETKLYMNIDEFLYFDQNNRLVNHG